MPNRPTSKSIPINVSASEAGFQTVPGRGQSRPCPAILAGLAGKAPVRVLRRALGRLLRGRARAPPSDARAGTRGLRPGRRPPRGPGHPPPRPRPRPRGGGHHRGRPAPRPTPRDLRRGSWPRSDRDASGCGGARGLPRLQPAPGPRAEGSGRPRHLLRLAPDLGLEEAGASGPSARPFPACSSSSPSRKSCIGAPGWTWPSWAIPSWMRCARPPIGRPSCASVGLDPARPVVALLPGSRRAEVAHNLPPLARAIPHFLARRPDLQFLVARAPGLADALFEARSRAAAREWSRAEAMRWWAAPPWPSSRRARPRSRPRCWDADGRGLPPVPPDLLPGPALRERAPLRHAQPGGRTAAIVPELIQRRLHARSASRPRACRLLEDPARAEAMRRDLAEVRLKLGAPGRVADGPRRPSFESAGSAKECLTRAYLYATFSCHFSV